MTVPTALDQVFRDHVANDVRGNLTEEEADELRSPENIDRWISGLIAVKGEVEVQLANRRAKWWKMQADLLDDKDGREKWLRFRAAEVDWRVRALRFLTSVEEHLSAAKELRRTQRHQSLDVLREAIRRHRDEMEEEASAEDVRLWQAAEDLLGL